MKNERTSKAEGGFTLVEVLIAVAIGSIMLTMVFVTLNMMLRSRQAVIDFSTPYAIGPQILDAIEADLRNAYFYDTEDNDAFWGADAELAGREADGLSFLTTTLGHVGEQELRSTRRIGQAEEAPRRRSPTTEVQYVCRPSPVNSDWLELWRREDFYVDDAIHDGGIYRLVYDRVFDFKLEYVSRSTTTGGLAGDTDQSVDQMRRGGWSSIEERGVPRAVIASIAIYAREAEKTWEKEPQVFVFRRWIPLPQVHMSTHSEGQIASWDGKLTESTGPLAPPRSSTGGGAGGGKDAGGGKSRGGGAQGGRGGTGGRGGGGRGGGKAGNPFSTVLSNRSPQSGGGGGAGHNPFADLFRPK